MTDITILFKDAEALVIDKPAGLPIDTPRKGGPSLGDHLDSLRLGFQRQPVPVHRLDTDTSGCLLLARNPKALKKFNKAFEQKLVEKTYLAILAGQPPGESGTIELALTKISSAEKGWRMIPAKKGKPSVSHWELAGQAGDHGVIRFRPETGRTHQLRVHAASGLGFPLLGDPVYGAGSSDGATRTMLHARSIVIPREGKPSIEATAPLPPDFLAAGVTDG